MLDARIKSHRRNWFLRSFESVRRMTESGEYDSVWTNLTVITVVSGTQAIFQMTLLRCYSISHHADSLKLKSGLPVWWKMSNLTHDPILSSLNTKSQLWSLQLGRFKPSVPEHLKSPILPRIEQTIKVVQFTFFSAWDRSPWHFWTDTQPCFQSNCGRDSDEIP